MPTFANKYPTKGNMDEESNASHDVNNYVTENIPRATPYFSIVQDVTSNFDKVKTQKQQLSLLRELSIYATAQHPSLDMFVPLHNLLITCTDSDNDRKIFRTALYIVSEMLQNDSAKDIDEARREGLGAFLVSQCTHQNASRAYVAWRIAGLLSDQIGETARLAQSAVNSLRGYQVGTKPTKWAKKATKKDYEEQLLLNTAKLSALRRTEVVNLEVIGALGLAIASQVADTARHALAILAKYAVQHPADVANVLQLQTAQSNETINTADTLCCIYAIRAYEGVAMADRTAVPDDIADAAYMKIIGLVGDTRLRIQTEAVRALTEHRNAWQRKITSEEKHQGLDVVQLLADTLSKAVKTSQGISLTVSCRTCALLGRFIVNRPRTLPPPPAVDNLSFFDMPLTPLTPIKDSVSAKLRALASALTDVLNHATAPYLISEVLKGLIWVIPDAVAWTDEMANVWKWLKNKLQDAQQVLPVELLGSVMRHLLGRMRDTPIYSVPLVESALSIGETYFRRQPSTALCGLIVQTWARVATYGPPVAVSLLRAICNALDILCYSLVDGQDNQLVESKLHSDKSIAFVDDLRRFGYWFLGEHSELWGSGFLPTDSIVGLYKSPTPQAQNPVIPAMPELPGANSSLTTVILRLQQGLWFEDHQTKQVCAQALCKLAVRVDELCTKTYLYHIIHEVQMNAFAEFEASSSAANVLQELDDKIEANLGALHSSIAIGSQAGLESVLMPTMVALDGMFTRLDQGVGPMTGGGMSSLMAVSSPTQNIPSDIQRLLHVASSELM